VATEHADEDLAAERLERDLRVPEPTRKAIRLPDTRVRRKV
jgi:hypothetical protein